MFISVQSVIFTFCLYIILHQSFQIKHRIADRIKIIQKRKVCWQLNPLTNLQIIFYNGLYILEQIKTDLTKKR